MITINLTKNILYKIILITCLLAGGFQVYAFGKTYFSFNKTMPVKISKFTARYNPDRQVVNLHWVTIKEKDGEQYIIERSLDSLHFIVIGQTKSLGSSSEPQHYYFDDARPVGGKMFYRIREVDPDGKQFLTEVVTAYKPITQLELAQIIPSPNGNELNFAVISPDSSAATVFIADVSGEIKASFLLNMQQGANLKSIYTGNLESGVYFLQVNDQEGGGSVIKKFIHKVPDIPKDSTVNKKR